MQLWFDFVDYNRSKNHEFSEVGIRSDFSFPNAVGSTDGEVRDLVLCTAFLARGCSGLQRTTTGGLSMRGTAFHSSVWYAL